MAMKQYASQPASQPAVDVRPLGKPGRSAAAVTIARQLYGGHALVPRAATKPHTSVIACVAAAMDNVVGVVVAWPTIVVQQF